MSRGTEGVVLGEGVGAGEWVNWGPEEWVSEVPRPLWGLPKHVRSLGEEAGGCWCRGDV